MSWPRLFGIAFAIGLHAAVIHAFVASTGPVPFVEGDGLENMTVIATVRLESGDLLDQDRRDASMDAPAVQAARPKEERTKEGPEKPVEATTNIKPDLSTAETMLKMAPKEEELQKAAEPPNKAEEQPAKPKEALKEAEKAPEHPLKDRKRDKAPGVQTQTGNAASDAQEKQRASARESARKTKLLSAYLNEISLLMQKFKASPRSNSSGDVIVQVTISQSGQLLSSFILKSSGQPDLDRTAIASVGRSAPFPPVPAEISAGPYTVTVPYQYRSR